MVNAIETLWMSGEMDAVLLWMTGQLIGIPAGGRRLMAGTLVGAVPTVWALAQGRVYAAPWAVLAVWPLVMLRVTMGRLPRRVWMKTYVVFVVAAVLAGGLTSVLVNAVSRVFPAWTYFDWAVGLVPVSLIGLTALLPRWEVRRAVGRADIGEVRLAIDGRTVTLPALWDSGNRLRDAVTGRPVVVVDSEAVQDWLAPEVLLWAAEVADGGKGPAPAAWRDRAGTVAYHSLGGPGQLAVLAVEWARGRREGRWLDMVPVMVGVAQGPIAHDRAYRALVAPRCLKHNPREGVGA